MLDQSDFGAGRATFEIVNDRVLRAHRSSSTLDVLVRLAAQDPEFSAASRACGAGVPKPLGVFEHEGQQALVFEDPGGLSLSSWSKAGHSLTQRVRMCQKLATAVAEIHDRGVICGVVPTVGIMVDKSSNPWIVDFSLATEMPREQVLQDAPRLAFHALPYISPEQTGRLGMAIDRRTDQYSVGVTCYELLAGHLPFESSDPLELVRCHLAKTPRSLNDVDPTIPPVLSAIVSRMLAKAPEDRYQNLKGVAADFERCANELEANNHVSDFQLGQNDAPNGLSFSATLFGRGTERNVLHGALDHVLSGSCELVLVSGAAGVGKSSVVRELVGTLATQGVRCARGKCELLGGAKPYVALSSAVNEVLSSLFSLEAAELSRWREAIVHEISPNGAVLRDVLPDLEKLTGPLPSVPELPIVEARHRFSRTFELLLRALASVEPLVLLLDDLQWADGASLDLLLSILNGNLRHLLFLCAHRNNDPTETPGFSGFLNAVQKGEARVTTLPIVPLKEPEVVDLLASTLHVDQKKVVSLARLCCSKTGGNPFFLKQFLRELYEDRLLSFDEKERTWVWTDELVSSRAATENVIQLMERRMATLPENTRIALRRVAALGSQFDHSVAASICGVTRAELSAALLPATELEYVLPLRENFGQTAVSWRFCHDRIQQAAYELTAPEDRPTLHQEIGLLLLRELDEEERDNRLFDIVDQLNRGQTVASEELRDNLAWLNLKAGERAKSRSAYEPARQYFAAGFALCEKGFPNTPSPGTELLRALAEAEYAAGNLSEVERCCELLLAHTTDTVEKARIHWLLALSYTMKNDNIRAIAEGRAGLKVLGRDVDDSALAQTAITLFERVEVLCGSKSAKELLDLPLLQDRETTAAVDLFDCLEAPAYLTGQTDLYAFSVLSHVELSVRFGNSPSATHGYGGYGILLLSHERYERAAELGQFAIDLAEKLHAPAFLSMACFAMSNNLGHWVNPLREHLPRLEQGFRAGLDGGDPKSAGYCLMRQPWVSFHIGQPLREVLEVVNSNLVYCKKTNNGLAINVLEGLRLLTDQLLNTPRSLAYKRSPESAKFVAKCEQQGDLYGLGHYLVGETRARLSCQDYEGALQSAEAADKIVPYFAGHYELADHTFMLALTLAISLGSTTDTSESRVRVDNLLVKLRKWAQHSEEFWPKVWFIEGTLAHHDGHPLLAIELLGRAAERAFPNDAMLVHDRLAAIWTGRKLRAYAERHLTLSMNGWTHWVADESSSAPISSRPHPENKYNINSGAALDLHALVSAARSISTEIVLPTLIDRLLHIVMQAAGAQRAVLFLGDEKTMRIEALCDAEHEDISRIGTAEQSSVPLPQSIVRLAQRTLRAVRVDDAAAGGMFASDPYVREKGLRSVLCQPLLRQGALTGLIYLENTHIRGVFDETRAEIVHALSTQAAISLENARLYRALEAKVEERTIELKHSLDKAKAAEAALRLELDDAAAHIRQLLPPHRDNPVKVRSLLVPCAQLGGDAFGHIVLENGDLAFFLFDVCGHGLASALTTISVLEALRKRNLDADYHSPSSVLHALNRAFPAESHGGHHFTMVYGVLSAQGELSVANAGHPPPVLVIPGQSPREVHAEVGPFVGISPESAWVTERISLTQPGALFVFSDGAFEIFTQHGGLLPYEEFVSRLTNTDPEHLESLAEFARLQRGQAQLEDDLSVLSLSWDKVHLNQSTLN